MLTHHGGDYDYLNARVRGMSTALLGHEVFDQLIATEGEELIIDVLLDSSYGEALSDAMLNRRGVDAVEEALRRNLAETMIKLRNIAPDHPRKLIDIQLNRWDVDNIVSIARGIRHRRDPRAMSLSMTPVGQFSPVMLDELAAEPDLRSLANSLTSWGCDFGSRIRQVMLAELDDASAARLESILHIDYFTSSLEALDSHDQNEAVLIKHLKLQIDLQNVMGMLKQIDARALGLEDVDIDRIPGGVIPPGIIDRLAGSDNVEVALEQLDRTEFAPSIERGILAYGQTDRLSVLERFFEALVLEKGVKLFRANPLGVAVPIGFIWRKINEFINLRALVRGKRYGLQAGTIREELVLV